MRGQNQQQRSSRLRVDCLQRGSSGLMYACQQGDLPGVVRILGDEPVSAYRQDRNRRTALHYCRGGAVAVPLVAAAPGLLDSPDRDGLTPLHLAVIQGDSALVSLLIAQHADVDALDNERHSVVHWATVCGELECLRLLLQAGAHPSAPDILGGCPLHYAAQLCGAPPIQGAVPGQAIRILKELLNAKDATVHAVDHEGRTPLLWAAAAGSAEAVIALVKAGARIEAADRDGLTALHCAASRGHTGCIETLITLCGASVDVIDCNGCTALHYAATLGHADATSLLLDLDAAPDRQDRKGRTPAHCACAKGQLETVKILASHKANLWIRNIKGDLPLHEAVASGRRELVLYLLQKKSGYINASGHDGKTLLHVAAGQDHADICKILLDQGAAVNPLYRTTRDILVTPLDCALHRGNKSTAKYLQLQGGVPAIKLNVDESNKNHTVKLQSIAPPTAVKHTKSSVLRSGSRLKTEGEGKKKDSESKTRSKPATVATFQEIEHEPVSSHVRTKSLSKIHCSSSSDDSNLEEFCTCTHRCHHGKRLYLLLSPKAIKRQDMKEARKNSHSDSDIHVRSHSKGDNRSSTSLSNKRDQRSSSKSANRLKSARSKYNKKNSNEYSSENNSKTDRKRDRSHSRSSKISRSKRKDLITSEDSSSSEEDSSDEYGKYKSRSKSRTSNRSKLYSRHDKHSMSSYSEDELSEYVKSKRRSKSVSSSPRSIRYRKKHEERVVRKSPRHVSEERIVKRKTCKTETTTKRKLKPNSDSESESESDEEEDYEIVKNVKKDKHIQERASSKHREFRSASDGDETDEKNQTKKESQGKKSKTKKNEKMKRSAVSEDSEVDDMKTKKKSQNESKATKNKKSSQVIKSKKGQSSKLKQKDDETADKTSLKSTKESKEGNDQSKKSVTSEKRKSVTSTVTEKKVSKESRVSQNDRSKRFTTSESEVDNKESDSGRTPKNELTTEAEIHRTVEAVVETEPDVAKNEPEVSVAEAAVESAIKDNAGEEVDDVLDGTSAAQPEAIDSQAVEVESETQTTIPNEPPLSTETKDNTESAVIEIIPGDNKDEESLTVIDPNLTEVKVAETETVANIEPPKELTEQDLEQMETQNKGTAESVADRQDGQNITDERPSEEINQQPVASDMGGVIEETPAIQLIEMVQMPERFIKMDRKSGDEIIKENFYSSDDDSTDSSDDSAKFETNQTPRTAVDELRFGSSKKFAEDGQSSIFRQTGSSLADTTTEPPNTRSSISSPGRRKKLKKRTKNRSRTLSEEVSERGYESSGMMDSGFEPSPRITTRAKSGGPRGVSKEWKATDRTEARPGRAKDRKPGDKNAVNMTTVNQTMQANIRRYYTERIIFQHLLELKRLQIRSSRANEAVLVKRAIDQFHRSGHQIARYSGHEFTYEAFERHLYDTLKKLQRVGSSNYKAIAEAFLENESKANPLFCTTKTFRCNHATHAYTGIPCAAYIPLMNHHTIPKVGFPKVPEASFLPRIKTAGKRDKNAVALELSHGNDKQLITLPTDRLDANKKYYVTFSVRGSNPGSEAEGKQSPKPNKTTPKV